MLLALFLLLVVALAAIWIQRRTITREFVDRELARRGVPAQYRIEQLSPWRQRLTDLVIGDPRRPDLTADWVEIRTALSPWRAEILVVRAGEVHIRGRLHSGQLSLGAIDKLLPPPSGAPFALPDLSIDVQQARLQLATPHGTVDLALSGRGLLRDGFRGTLQATAPRLDVEGCATRDAGASLRVAIRNHRIALTGPAEAARVTCGAIVAQRPRAVLDVSMGEAFAGWKGDARVAVERLSGGSDAMSRLRGELHFAGDAAGTEGTVALQAGAFSIDATRGKALRFAGRYQLADKRFAIEGDVTARSLRLPEPLLRTLALDARALSGTPVGDVATQAAHAVRAAARAFDLGGSIVLTANADGMNVAVPRLRLDAQSGARLRFDSASGDGLVWNQGLDRIGGVLRVQGGGLPDAELRVAHRAGRSSGSGLVRAYRAGTSSLALARIDFARRGGAGRLSTTATLSGPLGDGRIKGAVVPLRIAWDDAGWNVNPDCETMRLGALRLGAAALSATSLRLCPIGGGMVRSGAGGLAGGVRLAPVQLRGALGQSPLTFALGSARVDLARRRFALGDAAVTLGGQRPSRLAVSGLDGRYGRATSGNYAGLSGEIGGVPILVSQGEGDWRFSEGGATLNGRMRLSDAVTPARFHPLAAENATIRIDGRSIAATAALRSPKARDPVGDVHIEHDLAQGSGNAVIRVPDLRFAEGGFQPSDLTPLTFGVVADVNGRIAGQGRIAWNSAGVTSSGTFATEALDLAAAFGPVRGLSTQLRFVDLLGMRTAPGQAAAVAEVNPGVPVSSGTIGYQLLDSRRIRIEGARWPFAGGELVLDPTLLDFSEAGERRLTFHVRGADAALFLNEMGFDNLDATGVFDGTLPMVFDSAGGRIEGGFLRARSGGSLAYVGEVSQHDLGFWGNMAFEALKSLDYRTLEIGMNGPLAGEMITEISFAGVSQGEGTRSNFLIRRLAKLPFVFNVRISAPFYQLLDSVRSWYDPKRLIERNLPTLLEEESARETDIQAGESTQGRQGEVK